MSVAKSYRQLLRHIRTELKSFHVQLDLRKPPNTPPPAETAVLLRSRDIRSEILSNAAVTDKNQVALLRANLHAYVSMVTAVKELRHLRGLDSGEKLDPREKIRQSARRVGLSVPAFYSGDEDKKSDKI